MAGRQRRGRDSGDRRAELRLAAAARRRLITERDRRGVAGAEFRRERGRILEPAAVHVRTVAGVLRMSRLTGGTLAGVVAGRVGLRAHVRRIRRVTVGDVEGGMIARAIGPHQLRVRRISVMHVREQRLGREQAEAQRERARRQAAEEGNTTEEHQGNYTTGRAKRSTSSGWRLKGDPSSATLKAVLLKAIRQVSRRLDHA